ncbi:MAG TPA: hypothetical protein PKL81_10610 [Ferruginibacter sp.]|nr:hypothetical protein [Ferruginibacter sp.]HNA01019.1 hypothetical protein [Ferruginibacter sp.]HNA15845.1 hypothetical protein [Ferruginibacter sp.]HNJ28155.1 hypothetical protein [Ferruginibacter sp.]HNL65536.1 hypothetical protein [Ferruginibacter sp.]
MKKLVFALLLVSASFVSFAQDEADEKKGGFKKENLFTGGGLTVSFSNYTTVLGASPVLGYSINKWLDAGIVFNINYASNRHVTYYNPATGLYYYSDDKLRQTVFGPGAFVRAYPIKFLFVQALGEQNFITQKLIYDNGSPTEKTSISAPSLLLGVGYASGREGIGDLYYYISLMFDVMRDRNSPYVEETASGKINALPIFRAGLQIPLFQGKRNRW